MKVILTRDVKGVGRIGDVRDVADGYARNYLIPHGLAYQVGTKDAHIFSQRLQKLKKDMERRLKEIEGIKEELSKSVFAIKVKVGEGDKMFGSITAKDIANILKDAGYDIDRKDILLDEPIRALGMYEVDIKLGENVKGKVKIKVEKE
jgi:large subunit ribosomal protein L9